MEIIMKRVEELTPYERNPRRNDEAVKFVKASIEQFGFKVPIVIDANNIIVAGHTRLKAAEELGLKEVPCIVADDLTEEQVRAFRLADNKTGEAAEWDYTKLAAEMDALADKYNMGDFGFVGADLTDYDSLFVEHEGDAKERAPDMVTCPHCGAEVEA